MQTEAGESFISAAGVKAPEVCEGWVAPDLVLLANSLVLRAVNFCNLNLILRRFRAVLSLTVLTCHGTTFDLLVFLKGLC